MNPLALVRLLQLASPTLPVGAFSYSQGLEWQVDCGAIRTEADAGDWIAAVFDAGIASFELPLLAAQMRAWAADDIAAAPSRLSTRDEAWVAEDFNPARRANLAISARSPVLCAAASSRASGSTVSMS